MALTQEQPKDTIFRAFDSKQAANYEAIRMGYPQELIDTIINHHKSTKGAFDTFLDVGCGPGNAARNFAHHFRNAIGVDPSSGMVEHARQFPENKGIRFEVATSETLDTVPDLAPGSVDLLTAAMSAHWFDMPRFWVQAAKMLKPGGTVAIFTRATWYCHPELTPNAAKVQATLDEVEFGELATYRKGRDKYYNDLALPWELDPQVLEFEKQDYERKVWNDGGKLGPDGTFMCQQDGTMRRLAAAWSTSSSIIKWRKEHPELAGTDSDIITVMIGKLKEALGNTDENTKITGGCAVVLLLFKKKST